MSNLIISKDVINTALEFYNINDEEYANKCYRCLEKIQKDDNLIDNFNKIYEILYLNNFDRAEIKKLWLNQNKQEVFGKDCNPFITNILLLSGYTLHSENFKKCNVDDEQKQIHIKRVFECLTKDIYERNYDGIRISEMLWGAYFINMRIIEVGRLQYEFCSYNPLTEDNDESHIKIHIPNGTRLYIEDVKKSITDSKLYIMKYFNLKKTNYYCSSWLLSNELHEVLKKDSNIYNFYNLFEIVKVVGDASSDIMNFVFALDDCNDYKTLVENTSLQRIIKEMLINNKPINLSLGKLKEFI